MKISWTSLLMSSDSNISSHSSRIRFLIFFKARSLSPASASILPGVPTTIWGLSRDGSWFLNWKLRVDEKANGFSVIDESDFKQEPLSFVGGFNLLERNPPAMRPDGHWSCIEGVSWEKAGYTRDEEAAKDVQGVNWASLSNRAAVVLKPDACRCSGIRSKSSLEWQVIGVDNMEDDFQLMNLVYSCMVKTFSVWHLLRLIAHSLPICFISIVMSLFTRSTNS